jgi:hypothetical protein
VGLSSGVWIAHLSLKAAKPPLGWIGLFYNGSASRNQKGLEISVIAVIDVEARRGYSLSVQQTPGHLAVRKAKTLNQSQRIPWEVIESAKQRLDPLPDKSKTDLPVEAVESKPTRIDHYLEQLKATHPYFPTGLKYLSVDGFYSKQKFVDGVIELDLQVIGKLRNDANLRYLYKGAQKPRGAKRKYDGKVDLSDLSRFTPVRQLEPQLNLYTSVVWHVSLKRQIRLVGLVDTRKAGKVGVTLLFSTDVKLDAERILEYYKARFQIEFIFRDAKQFTGLCDAQTRDPKRLDFHFNASLSALNLAKYEHQVHQQTTDSQSQSAPFSMSTYKRIAFNDHLLERFISKLDLNRV